MREPKLMMAVAFAMLAATSLRAADGFAAGRWAHETNLVSADVPGIPQWLVRLFAGHGSRKSCNMAAELAAHPETLLTADDAAVCRLRRLSLAGGRLVFDTFCTNKRFPDGLLVSSVGSYTQTSYSISTTSTGVRDGKPVRILTTGTGKKIADQCAKP